MSPDCAVELEDLVTGKTESVEIDTALKVSREIILETLNKIIFYVFPGSWTVGEFVSRDDSEYLVYDVHLCGSRPEFSSIRFLEFANFWSREVIPPATAPRLPLAMSR